MERLGFLAAMSHRWDQFRASEEEIFISEKIPSVRCPLYSQKRTRAQSRARYGQKADSADVRRHSWQPVVSSKFCHNGIRLPLVRPELS
jgi:hypothetical protein